MHDSIIVIDSGIEPVYVNHQIKQSFEYDQGTNLFSEVRYSSDCSGHGSASASIIYQKCPDSFFTSVKVLNANSKSSIKKLIDALEFCEHLDSRIINLSLAVTDGSYEADLDNVCEKLKNIGKIIICSVANGCRSSYPAKFSSVIGVRGSILRSNQDYWFNHEKEIQCVANLLPSYTSKDLGRFCLFGGNSKAASLISGFAFDIIKKNRNVSFEDLLLKMEQNSNKVTWNEQDFCYEIPISKINDSLNEQEKEVMNRLICILEKGNLITNFKESPIPINSNLFDAVNGSILRPDNVGLLISLIEQEFHIDLCAKKLDMLSFVSIHSLIKFIKGQMI